MAKKNNGESAANGDGNARLITSPEDQVKAGKWFHRARELGEKRQFDYAIEYYVNGLEFWPDAVEEACKPLHGCAVARRQTGGKKPGLKDTMKRSLNDKNARKAFLNALWLFGHDPDSLGYLEGVTKNASRLRADDTALWASCIFLRAMESAAKAPAKQFQALVQLLDEMGDRATERGDAAFGVTVFQAALDTLTVWRRRFPKDDKAEMSVKNLSTKLTILKGKYEESGSFRDSVVDSDLQRDLHDEHRSVQSDDRVDELVAKAEAKHKQNLDDGPALKKLVDMLCRRERNEDEKRAIEFLTEAYQRNGEYRWKQLADDIRIKQLGRRSREVAKAGDADELKEHRRQRLRFELGVFKERTEQYPTDNRLRFEYGVRQFRAGRFDDAIPLFQSARGDPKNRAACGMFLGRCFFRKGYHDQAIGALREAVQHHQFHDDELAKNMRYWLGRAQEAGGEPDAARKTYGELLQLDYNFSDVRARMDALSKEGPAADPGGD